MIRQPRKSPLFPSTALFRSFEYPLRHAPLLLARVATVGSQPTRDGGAPSTRPFGTDGLANGGRDLAREEPALPLALLRRPGDRKSTRLNSSHANISHDAFCL